VAPAISTRRVGPFFEDLTPFVITPPNNRPMLANAGDGRYVCHMSICYVDSPVGRLAIEADLDAVTSVRWTGAGERARDVSSTPLLAEAKRQLDRYFAGKLKRFRPAARGARHRLPEERLEDDV
jgi:O6-methylguanine-DNA--protein-cysteine methyltransferase